MESISSIDKSYPYYIDQDKDTFIEKLITQFGNSNSMALSDPNCKLYSTPNINGVIGYRFKWGHAVVFGDPVCHEQDLVSLIGAFHQFCKDKNKKIIYTAVSKKFTEIALKQGCKASIEIGEEVILNPQKDLLKGTKARKLRLKIHQAEKESILIQEFFNDDELVKKKIEDAAFCWLSARKGPQIYLSKLNIFESSIGKRWFYSMQNGEVTGVLILNRIEASQGWFISFLVTIPDAVKGTSEFLLLSAMSVLKKEGCIYLTAGTIPKDSLGDTCGIGSFTKAIAKCGFKLMKRFFNLNGKRRYWKKFQPHFDKSYLVFEKPSIGLCGSMAIVTALNGEF